MNITITLNNNNIEWITSDIIKKMYQLSVDSNNTISFSGYLKSPSGYASLIGYLNNMFDPGLKIEVTQEYLEFEDPAAEVLCAKYFGDGTGCSEQQLRNANSWWNVYVDGVRFISAFPTSGIKKFNEFQYFPVSELSYHMFAPDGVAHSLEEITLPNSPIIMYSDPFGGGKNDLSVIVHNMTSVTHMEEYSSNRIVSGYILDFNKYTGRFENNGYGRSEIAFCGNEYIILARNSVLNRTSSDNFEMTCMYYAKTVVFREDFVCAGLNLKGYGNNQYGIPSYTSLTSIVFLGATPPFSSINLSWNLATLYAPSSATSAYSTASGKTVQPLETFANISDANKDILVEAGCTVTGSTGNWTVTPPTA